MEALSKTLHKRIIIAGHYGTGKTNIAVNLALQLNNETLNVTVVDMDIVNPYFRTSDNTKLFEDNNIKIISSQFANTNVDISSIPSEIFSTFVNDEYTIYDVGGNDTGAIVLRQFKKQFDVCGYSLLVVINQRRPDIETPKLCFEMIRSIEYSSGLTATGIINNTHLCDYTNYEVVLQSLDYAYKTSELSGLPIIAHTIADKNIADKLRAINTNNVCDIEIYTKRFC